jgi:hypothetical protein
MGNWIDRVDQARKQDAAELTRLRAENARLREAGQAVVTRWDSPHWVYDPDIGVFMEDLRAALKEGGGE